MNHDNTRVCLTPGALFHTEVHPASISVSVDLPMEVGGLSEQQAEILDCALHDAVEPVISYAAWSKFRGFTSENFVVWVTRMARFFGIREVRVSAVDSNGRTYSDHYKA